MPSALSCRTGFFALTIPVGSKTISLANESYTILPCTVQYRPFLMWEAVSPALSAARNLDTRTEFVRSVISNAIFT